MRGSTLGFVAGALVGALTACGGTGSGATSSGSTTGAIGTGTGGTSGGKLADGAPCEGNAACQSGVCGASGSGNCCSRACSAGSSDCGATACDSSGSCIYKSAGSDCGQNSCIADEVTPQQCDGFGNCFTSSQMPCPDGYACDDAGTACNTSCGSLADCATGNFCQGGACVSRLTAGPCTENDECASGVCGLDGGGNCCNAACAVGAPCGATGCDATTGACDYPDASIACGQPGQETCSGTTQTNPNVFCDGQGSCSPVVTDCAPYICGATACLTSCASNSSCVDGGYCDADAGICLTRVNVGPCSSDADCASGICGIAGIGHCCNTACTSLVAPCGATDCDATTGQCNYPSATACGTAGSCSGTTEQPGESCDGLGNCKASASVDCSPFICGPTACDVSCTDSSSCIAGGFCDLGTSHCCAGISAGATLDVDGVNGLDTTACCGYGGAGACQTIAHAMALIDAAQAKNVTIQATLGGMGGDWPATETYPIALGWGVELSAPGVNFSDDDDAEIFDIAAYSANDTLASASIVGSGTSLVIIGLSKAGAQSFDQASIQVESGATLSIADATVVSNAAKKTIAIKVAAGGTLKLGQDASGATQGGVNVGTSLTQGWDGIVCASTAATGCTIGDAALAKGRSVTILNQEDVDIDAEDNASITLQSAPAIGVAPSATGFLECPSKTDVSQGLQQAVLLNGSATVTFVNGAVQCISGTGFKLVAGDAGTGNPTLNLGNTTVQNTEQAIFASAGTATLWGSTIQFNYDGVEQATDGTNIATVDLDGTDGGGNTVVCSDGEESIGAVDGGTAVPGVDVLNTTTSTLNASNVAWDTTSPDLFMCNASLEGCTCEIPSCTNPGNDDDMDAVYESTGTITTTGNTQSAVAVANNCN